MLMQSILSLNFYPIKIPFCNINRIYVYKHHGSILNIELLKY